jgi:hypothetical protein
MTINDVVRFKNLKNLNRLSVSDMKDVKPLMKVLPKLNKLIRLDISKCKLDSDDLKAISEIERLSYLDLTAVGALNDTSLRHFLKPQFLNAMDLESCKLTRASIPTFQAMPSLRFLRLTDAEESSAPDSFRSQLKKALPNVEFNWQEPISLGLESP